MEDYVAKAELKDGMRIFDMGYHRSSSSTATAFVLR